MPDDLSVVGFDGIEFAEFVTPTLTTVQQPRHEIGRNGARALIEALSKGTPPKSVKLDGTAHHPGQHRAPSPHGLEAKVAWKPGQASCLVAKRLGGSSIARAKRDFGRCDTIP